MSIQSEWQEASKEPAVFELSYAEVKVQAVRKGDEIQVRLATSFNTDWMEAQFDEWIEDNEDDTDVLLTDAYPFLKRYLDALKNFPTVDNIEAVRAIGDLVNAIEQANPGLVRA